MALPTAASVVSAGLAAYPTVFYDRVALDTLRNNLFFYPACDLRQMPDRSGVAMQIFDYTPFAANTVAATDGTPGSGQALTQNTGTINLSQYVDYVSFSDKVVLTAISDVVAEGARELAYRGALSVDTVIRNAVDTASTGSKLIQVANGSYLTTSVLRQGVMSLRSDNAKPKENGLFMGIVHSLAAFDLVNDATAGGFIDLRKYTEANAPENMRGIVGAHIGQVGGLDLWESNNVTITANYLTSGKNGYSTYIAGHQAWIASSLGKTQLGDKNFSVKVSRFDQGNSIDPAGVIRAAASYNFFFGVVMRPSTAAFRTIQAESSIG